MVSSSTVLEFFLSLAVKASAETIHQMASSTTQGLQWGPCNLNTTLPVQCAKLTVPLDYTNSSDSRTISLDVIKYPAQKEPKRGSILLNFGGPGQDGLNSMLAYAPIQGPITGGYHDLISWDPRGTGNTLLFNCFPVDPTGYYAGLGNTLASAADTAVGLLWAQGQIISETCYNQLKDIGDYVGMAFVARDMMSIVDALGEDGLLRYWGISGGTTLGATVAAMFPDKVDKVVLDGVMNAHQYYNMFGEPEMVAATDATWEQFLRGCIAMPQNCALAHNRTFEELEATMLQLFTKMRESPPVYNGSIVFDLTIFKSHVYNSLYRPSSWPGLALAIDDLLQGNLDTFAARILGGAGAIPQQAQAILGIRCGDKRRRTGDVADLAPDFAQYRRQSRWFWDWAWGYYVTPCAQWKFSARERYEGDFRVKTRSPLLFVGNTFDPVTPLVSARNMSEGFEGSVLLTHNGHGHLALSQPSNCTDMAIQRYFLEGILPAPGTVCEPNLPLFATGA
ncbi:TAP-like protein-domain-containing protein [Hypoxylon rubiginosum]|uniref:TAP-like protein-domain-containing protein n=1 Tax=Hypoxylon rubiginosum TaxID=110542 RepID=A0ACB9YXH5_9PEZI|nr:TAP-like protein-domain-containing protein [Hypoxylon rubiginosum]